MGFVLPHLASSPGPGRRAAWRAALLGVAATAGCASLIGFPDYGTSAAGTGGTGGMAATSTTTTTSTMTGTAGAPGCVEGVSCYLGLDGTEGIGVCKGGTQSCEGGVPVCDDVRPAIQACSAADTNCDGLPGCTGQFRWAASGLAATFTGVAGGMDGTVALAGNSTGAPGFFLATFDARGRPCWPAPVVFNGGGTLAATAVALSGGKVTAGGKPTQAICAGDGSGIAASPVVVGNVTGMVDFGQGMQGGFGMNDGFVAAVDPAGKVAWGHVFGSAQDDAALAVATGPGGAIYLTGTAGDTLASLPCKGALDGGAPMGGGVLVAKLTAGGACDWVRVFPGDGTGTSIAVDGDGKVVVVGTMSTMVDFDGTVISAMGGAQAFVVRLLPDGSPDGAALGLGCSPADPPFVAASPLPSPQNDVFVMCSFPAGGVCGGAMGDPPQSIVVHLDTSLTGVGDICYTGPAAVLAQGVAVDGAGSLVALLSTGGPVTSPGFGSPIAVGGVVALKQTAPYMDYAWATVFGAGTTFNGFGVAVDGLGDVLVASNPMGAVATGPVMLAPGGAAVVELAP